MAVVGMKGSASDGAVRRLLLRTPYFLGLPSGFWMMLTDCPTSLRRDSVWSGTRNVVDNHSVYWFRTHYQFQPKLFL